MAIKLGMTVNLKYIAYPHARLNSLDLDARSQWASRGKNISIELSRQLSK